MKYDAASVLPGKTPQMIAGMPDGDIVSSVLERWSPPTDFGRRYSAALRRSSSLSIMLNAACVALELDPEHKKLVSLKARSGSEKSFIVRAKIFVLAAGGVEVPRLLLSSNQQIPGGIGNRHDLVGRYYMTHIAGLVSTAHLDVAPDALAYRYESDSNGVYVRRRVAISEEAQRRERLPNISIQFHHPPVDDTAHGSAVLSAVFIAKHIGSIRRGIAPGLGIVDSEAKETLDLWLRHVRNLVVDLPGFVTFVPRFAYLRYLRRHRIPSVVLPTKQSVFPLHYHAEQSPHRNSRIVLSNDRDKYGVPRPRLEFHVPDSDIDGIYRAHALIDRYLRRHKIGHLRVETGAPMDHIRREMRAINGHFIGTTRMSSDSQKGVVDSDCKVFGVENLFISSSSTFPTSSHANPTLTIVALAIRLADHLRKKIWSG
jgi:choline dehydrogenase-like flavoprotein